MPMYGPPRCFAGLDVPLSAYDAARAVILPVPYDATTTFRGGARDGPLAIINASMQLELYDMELGYEPSDSGIHTLPDLELHLGGPSHMVARVTEAVGQLLADGKFPVMLGGEHTLTAGAVAACAAAHPDLAILYLDAHADVRGPYLGAEFNHASALRLSLEALRRVRPWPAGQPPAVAVGIRSMASEEATYVQDFQLPLIEAAMVALTRRSGQGALTQLWKATLEKLGPPGRPLYVSVDLDCFDPSVMPSVGTPEPGGLDWYEVLALLRAASDRHPLVMADVVELAPGEGPMLAAFTAAKLVYKLVAYATRSPATGRRLGDETG